MKTSARVTASTLAAVVLGLAAISSAYAIPVISNGGFEAGLTSWTKADQLGSEGTFFNQSGTVSPVNGDPVPAPPEGTKAAMTDAQGPRLARPLPGLCGDGGRRGAKVRALHR